MWPGQQPPGGEQNQQNQDPYPQQGYQQPVQGGQGYPQQGQFGQPGYPPQPNPYQQPTVPMYGGGGQTPGPAGPAGPGGGRSRRTTVIAVVSALAVVAAAGVSTYLVTSKKDAPVNVLDPAPSASASASVAAPPPAQGNPRGGGGAKPTIPGWKVVTNPGHATQFDVPPEWEVEKPDLISGFEDAKKGDGSPLVTFSAPAFLKPKWCEVDSDHDGKPDDTGLAATGTKGGEGAKDTGSAAVNEAGSWAWGGYAQQEPEKTVHDKVKVSKAVPYTTKSGLKGSYATATTDGVTKKTKCDTDGKSLAFTFLNGKGDYTTFVFYGARGVPDEVPEKTVMQILSTVRLPAGTEE